MSAFLLSKIFQKIKNSNSNSKPTIIHKIYTQFSLQNHHSQKLTKDFCCFAVVWVNSKFFTTLYTIKLNEMHWWWWWWRWWWREKEKRGRKKLKKNNSVWMAVVVGEVGIWITTGGWLVVAGLCASRTPPLPPTTTTTIFKNKILFISLYNNWNLWM